MPKLSFDTFWNSLKHDEYNEKGFRNYLGKEVSEHYEEMDWFDHYRAFLRHNEDPAASTEYDLGDLHESYPFVVFSDFQYPIGGSFLDNKVKNYFYQKDPVIISNSWHFERRFKNENFAREYVHFMNTKNVESNCDKTTDWKTVMQWMIDDHVVYCQVHEGENWFKVDPNNFSYRAGMKFSCGHPNTYIVKMNPVPLVGLEDIDHWFENFMDYIKNHPELFMITKE